MNRADVKPEIREFLMRHKAGNSAMSVSNLMIICDATEDNEILYAYLKVIPSLTILKQMC